MAVTEQRQSQVGPKTDGMTVELQEDGVPGPPDRRERLGNAFWRLWAAMGISASGDGLFLVALPLLTYSLTHNLLAIAGVSAANGISRAISSLPGGLLADRYERRTLMVTCNFVSGVALVALVLAMSLGFLDLPVVYLVAVVIPVSDNIWDISAKAYIPDITSPGTLATANGRLQAVDGTGEQVLGPAVGGLLFAASRRLPFLGDAISFFFSALLTTSLPTSAQRTSLGSASSGPGHPGTAVSANGAPRHARPTWHSNLKIGFVAFTELPALQLLALAVAWLTFCFVMVFSLFVYYGRHVLHLDAGGYGIFLASAALIGVAGSFLAGPLQRRIGLSRLILVGSIAVGVSYVTLSFTRQAVPAVFAFGLQEVGMCLANVGFVTVRQKLVPRHVFGRVQGIYRLFTSSAIPLGALAASFLSSHWGITTNMFIAGVLELAALPFLLPPLLRRLRPFLPA